LFISVSPWFQNYQANRLQIWGHLSFGSGSLVASFGDIIENVRSKFTPDLDTDIVKKNFLKAKLHREDLTMMFEGDPTSPWKTKSSDLCAAELIEKHKMSDLQNALYPED
jgi:hypothetical protein